MLNHLTIQGRLVANPTFGNTNAGGRFANFRMAWSEKYKDKENKCFLECKAFGGTAEFMEKYINSQGQEFIAEGKLNTEEWEKDGQKRSKIVLNVSAVHFCGKKQDGVAGTAEAQTEVQPNLTPIPQDELPF